MSNNIHESLMDSAYAKFTDDLSSEEWKESYVSKPNFVIRILIFFFGNYENKVWYNDGEDAEIGRYYNLFWFRVCLGSTFVKNYQYEITHKKDN